jgi:Fungal Zn(2)-Cys(6) binuclear cluster domain
MHRYTSTYERAFGLLHRRSRLFALLRIEHRRCMFQRFGAVVALSIGILYMPFIVCGRRYRAPHFFRPCQLIRAHGFPYSHPISRSRRRSCRACASLKVKCDLRQPCSKCEARGRDCVYQQESPQMQEEFSLPSIPQDEPSVRKGFPSGVPNVNASAGFDPWSLARPMQDHVSLFPELPLIEESNNASVLPLNAGNLAELDSITSGGRSTSHAYSLPNIDWTSINSGSAYVPPRGRAFTSIFPSSIDPSAPGYLPKFSSNMFEPFFHEIFSSKPSRQDTVTSISAVHMNSNSQPSANDFGTLAADGLDVTDPFMLVGDGDVSFMDQIDQQLMNDLMSTTFAEPPSLLPPPPPPVMHPSNRAEVAPSMVAQDSVPSHQDSDPSHVRLVDSGAPEPTQGDLEHYRTLLLRSWCRIRFADIVI